MDRPLLLKRRRILDKNGKLNVFFSEIPQKYYRYVKDLGNTLITIRWRWILLSLCIANGIAWVLFAFMWMGIAVLKGDADKDKNRRDICIVGTTDFTGYLLLSIETLTTIGFGEIYPADCHEGWVVLTLQALTGVAIEGALVTAVYVKMSRPSTKHSVKLFSRKAVICLRDGRLCLIFRIYDECGKYWAKTKIRAYFIQKRETDEKEVIDNFVYPLMLKKWGLIMWPYDVVHVIDKSSPLWDFSARDLLVRSALSVNSSPVVTSRDGFGSLSTRLDVYDKLQRFHQIVKQMLQNRRHESHLQLLHFPKNFSPEMLSKTCYHNYMFWNYCKRALMYSFEAFITSYCYWYVLHLEVQETAEFARNLGEVIYNPAL